MYKEKRYNTNLISKEHSELYHESKKFLQDYYSQIVPDFKKIQQAEQGVGWNDYMKETKGTTWLEYYAKTAKDGTHITNASEVEKRLSELSYSDFDPEKHEYIYRYKSDKNYQKWATEKYRSIFLENLNNKNFYYSITNYKPNDMREEGYLDRAGKKVFMSIPKDSNNIDTTPIHELSHKSEMRALINGAIPEIDEEKIHKNIWSFLLTQKDLDYLSQDVEIHARKMSTLFYLHKTGRAYRNISMPTLLSLYNEYNDLPMDVGQLLLLFQLQTKDLLDYLNNNEN